METQTLDRIRALAEHEGACLPRDLLPGCWTGLVLFAAAFNGRQDAVWLEEAGILATCVDLRDVDLCRMRDLYPPEWRFVWADAFEFADQSKTLGLRFDVVTVDCPTGLFDRCLGLLELWTTLARRLVVLGMSSRAETPTPPGGWAVAARTRRSDFRGGVDWLTLEKTP
jgi:hypothetical protein